MTTTTQPRERWRAETCPACEARPDLGPCDVCNDYGWIWGDGVAPTACPNTMPGRDRRLDSLPCGRKGPTCPGCGRAPSEIGGDDDIARTRARKGVIQ